MGDWKMVGIWKFVGVWKSKIVPVDCGALKIVGF